MNRNKRELVTGMRLYPESMPVPTLKIEKKIHSIAKVKRFSGGWKDDSTFQVRKQTLSDEADREVPHIKYNPEDYIKNNYSLNYKDGENGCSCIGYVQMDELEGHVLVDEGIYFVQSGKLYFLAESDRTFYCLADAPGIVAKLAIDNRGALIFDIVVSYKKTVSNQRYEVMQGDYTGYNDYYEVKMKKLQMEKRVWMDLINKERSKMFSNNMEQQNNSYWTQIYGDTHYVEYDGDVFCVVPLWNVLNWGVHGNGEGTYNEAKDWMIVRFEPKTGRREVLKLIKNWRGGSLGNESGDISFTIFNGKLYLWSDIMEMQGEYYTKIICYDINTDKSDIYKIKHENLETTVNGVFQSGRGEVIVTTEYDFYLGMNVSYIETRIGNEKECLLGGINRIEGYNEQNIYYWMSEELYVVDTSTFKVTNLNEKLTKAFDCSIYGIDVKRNLIYIEADAYKNKMIAINMDNEIVVELSFPKIPKCVEDKGITLCTKRLPRDKSASGIFFNGENWLIRWMPEDVEYSEVFGNIIFDREGNEVGRFLQDKESGYVSRYAMRFFLPHAVSFCYELVDGQGMPLDFGVEVRGSARWNTKLFYIKENIMEESGVVLGYPYES